MILACSILAATLVPLVSRRAVLATAVGLPAPAAASALRPDFLPPPRLPDDATEVTFVVSGSAGPDVYSTEIVAAMQSESRVVLPLDWRTNRRGDSWSIFSSALSAGANGRQYGEAVGREIGERHPRSVHVVAISAGAFAADSLITSARRADPSTYLRLTLLDGFTADGALSAFQDDEAAPGLISFGRDADFAEAYINTDDPVPSTSLPLQQMANYDVTGARSRASFEPLAAARGDSLHLWPAAYYAQVVSAMLKDEGSERPRHGVGRAPSRGTLTVVS